MAKKGEANAGQRRKARNPKISIEKMVEHQDNLQDQEILQLAYRFDQFEKMLENEELNAQFIALEALSALVFAIDSGRTEEQLRTAWPGAWGERTVALPLALVNDIAAGWREYREDESGRKLGEVFKIEAAKHQGSHFMKSKLATRDRWRCYAREVMTAYSSWDGDKNPSRLEDAINQVAIKHNVSDDTVKSAYHEFRKEIHAGLDEIEVLKR
jgi:hypothetical protein